MSMINSIIKRFGYVSLNSTLVPRGVTRLAYDNPSARYVSSNIFGIRGVKGDQSLVSLTHLVEEIKPTINNALKQGTTEKMHMSDLLKLKKRKRDTPTESHYHIRLVSPVNQERFEDCGISYYLSSLRTNAATLFVFSDDIPEDSCIEITFTETHHESKFLKIKRDLNIRHIRLIPPSTELKNRAYGTCYIDIFNGGFHKSPTQVTKEHIANAKALPKSYHEEKVRNCIQRLNSNIDEYSETIIRTMFDGIYEDDDDAENEDESKDINVNKKDAEEQL